MTLGPKDGAFGGILLKNIKQTDEKSTFCAGPASKTRGDRCCFCEISVGALVSG